MVQLTSRERVDAFWSNTLGVEATELHTPGITVFRNPPQRATWRGIYVLAFDKGATVFTPSDLHETVAAAVADLDADAVLEPATWSALLGDSLRSAVGPMVHHYRDAPDGLAELGAGRRINPRDADALAALRTAVPAEEWTSAGFTAQPAVLFGLFDGDQMMAAANLTAGPDAATDIGIVVHPEARGRGYGRQLTATAARQALLMHGIARLRVLASSQSTLAIAGTLGFEEYGRNLAAYLT